MEGVPLPSYSSAVSSLPRLRGDGMDSDKLLPNTPILLGSSPPNPPPPRHRNLNSSSKAATVAKTQKPKRVPKEPTKGAVGQIKPRIPQESTAGTSLKSVKLYSSDQSQPAVGRQTLVSSTGLVPQPLGHQNSQESEVTRYTATRGNGSSELTGRPSQSRDNLSLNTSRVVFFPDHVTKTPPQRNLTQLSGEHSQNVENISLSTDKIVFKPNQVVKPQSRIPIQSERSHSEGHGINLNTNRLVFGHNPGQGRVTSVSANSGSLLGSANVPSKVSTSPPGGNSDIKIDMKLGKVSRILQEVKDNGSIRTEAGTIKQQDAVSIAMTYPPPPEEREVEGQSQPATDIRLQSKVDTLTKELEQQAKINSDLKKLLVASVGDDLHWKMDALVQTKTQLASEIGGYTEKLRKDYEELDTLSIQADMWKSKFMATRVLLDQLSKDTERLTTKNLEAERALKHLMQERQELHSSMVETHRFLKFLRDSFDPVHALRAQSIIPNILELARTNQLLSEAIKTKLLGNMPLVTVALDAGIQNGLTPAEKMAYQILMSDMQPCKQVPGRLPSQHLGQFGRFHPHVREEGIQWTCCRNCRGDVHVV